MSIPHRDAFREMLESVVANGHKFDECKEALKRGGRLTAPASRCCVPDPVIPHLTLRYRARFGLQAVLPILPGDRYTRGHHLEVRLSRIVPQGYCERSRFYGSHSGMAPLIRAVLSNLIGDEEAQKIEIVSNEVAIHPDGKWDILYRHPSR